MFMEGGIKRQVQKLNATPVECSFVLGTQLQTQPPANGPGEAAGYGPRPWAPAVHVADPDGNAGSWL